MSDSVTKYYETRGYKTNHTNESKEDKIVEDVLRRFKDRSKVGVDKYNTTLEDSKEGFGAFLNHLQEELMDATLYIEKLKQSNGR